MTVFWFVLAVLATFRVANMIAREEGPFDMFAHLRSKVGKKHWVARGLQCPLCISFWLSWAAVLLLPFADWQQYLLLALGCAGSVLGIYRWLDRA